MCLKGNLYKNRIFESWYGLGNLLGSELRTELSDLNILVIMGQGLILWNIYMHYKTAFVWEKNTYPVHKCTDTVFISKGLYMSQVVAFFV